MDKMDEIRTIARSMITCSHYNNLPDWKLDVYLKEIIALIEPPKEDCLKPKEEELQTEQ